MALITGASSGIGAGTSVLFAKLGVLLALNGRDVENLNKVAKQCTDCGAAEVTLIPTTLCRSLGECSCMWTRRNLNTNFFFYFFYFFLLGFGVIALSCINSLT